MHNTISQKHSFFNKCCLSEAFSLYSTQKDTTKKHDEGNIGNRPFVDFQTSKMKSEGGEGASFCWAVSQSSILSRHVALWHRIELSYFIGHTSLF